MGDLAFGTVGMEVETGVRERLPIMTVILNNSVMGGYGHHMPTRQRAIPQRTGCPATTRASPKASARTRSESSAPRTCVAAIERAIAATRDGQPAVLEMITKEDPVYPVATQVLQEAAKELVTA